MNKLKKDVKEYLAVRRALGYELRLAGAALHNFVSFLSKEGASFITTELALRWATLSVNAQPAQWSNRLSMVRQFTQYQCSIDPRTEIPPKGLLPHRYHRKPPYIYSNNEIKRLVKAAKQLFSPKGLKGWTYSTLFGLLAVTGMRISEPIGLDQRDVDLQNDVITIRNTKFGKSRLIPIHQSTRLVLQKYVCLRDRIFPKPKSPGFFVSEQGTRLLDCTVRWTFVKLSHKIGLRKPSDSHGPRLHDLRHRFATRTLINWYRASINVENQMHVLATYLGHRHVTDTYWYLSSIPELLQLATMRMEKMNEGGLS